MAIPDKNATNRGNYLQNCSFLR